MEQIVDKKKKTWKKVGLVAGLLTYFSIVIILFEYLGITCVFKAYLGVPCPGCGMTRALWALLRLDFREAFLYNPLIFAMPYVFAYIIFDFKGKIHKYILLAIGISAIINWVFNIFGYGYI